MKEIHHTTDNSGSVLVVTVQPSNSRSVSPLTPSREIRGLRLFRAISRKLGRRSNDDLCYNGEDDSRSSSTDSCSSTSAGRCPRTKKSMESDAEHSGSACGSSTNLSNHYHRSHSPQIMSSSSNSSSNNSETSSETHEKLNVRHRHHHSTTAASIRRAFENLTFSTRSHSCDNTSAGQSNKDSSKRTSKKSAPKRILRQPVTYTYVRGMSGLPTQRIPRTNAHYYNRTHNGCYCGHQYFTHLNRY